MHKYVLIALASSMYLLMSMCGPFSIGELNNAKPALEVFINESYWKQFGRPMGQYTFTAIYGTLTSVLLVGTNVALPLAGFLCDRFGRLKSIMLSTPLFVAGCLLMSSAEPLGTFELLYVGRTMQGFGYAVSLVAVRMFIVEIASPKWRSVISAINIPITAFPRALVLILSTSAALGTIRLWPFLVSFSVPFAIILFMMSWKLLESPLHLILHRPDQAIYSFEFYEVDGDARDFDRFVESANRELDSGKRTISLRNLPRSQWKTLMLAICLSLASDMNVRTIYDLYGLIILEAAGIEQYNASNALAIIGYVEIAVSFIAIPLFIKCPRKRLFTTVLLIEQFSMLLVIVCSALSTRFEWTKPVCIFGLALGYVVVPLDIATRTLIQMEICNQQYRSKFTSTSSATGCFVVLITSIIFPTILKAGGTTSAILPLLVINVFLLVIIQLFIPETDGRDLRDNVGDDDEESSEVPNERTSLVAINTLS